MVTGGRTGKAEVSSTNFHPQSTVGKSGRCCGHKHHDGRFSVGLLDGAGSKSGTPSSCYHERRSHRSSHDFHPQMAGNWSCKRSEDKDSSVVLPSFYQTQEERQLTSSDRLIRVESFAENPHFQNGNSGSNFQSNFRHPMGLFSRHRRCILSCPYELGLSQVSSLQTERSDICIPVPSVRTVPSSLGFLQDSQTHQTATPFSSDLHLLIPRRLHNLCNVSNSSSRGVKVSSESTPITGFQNKLEEIQLDTISGGRVSGRHVEPQNVSTFSSSGQTNENLTEVSGVSEKGFSISERTGELDRRVELRRILHRLGASSSDSHYDVGQSKHVHSFKGHSNSSGQRFKVPTSDLVKSSIPKPSCSDASCQTINFPDDGCLPGGLVWHPSPTQDSGEMGSLCTISIHELERAEGSPSSLNGVPKATGGESCPTSLGQYYDSGVSQTSRISEAQTPTHTDIRDSTILQEMGHQSTSCSSEGCSERPGRPGISPTPNCHGMVSGPDNLHMADVTGSKSSGGSFCDEGEYSTTPVHIPLPGSSSGGVRCIQHVLEPLDVHIPDATLELPGPSGFTPDGVQRDGNSGGPLLAHEGLVPSSSPQMSEDTSTTSREFHPVSDDVEGSSGSQRSVLEPSRLDTVSGPMVDLGLDEEGVHLVSHAHRPSTVNQYQGTWKRFLDYLQEKNISHQDVTKVVVMNFLAHQYTSRKLAYRTIATYKCALAVPLELTFNIKLDDTPVNLLMKGVFNNTPPRPAPMALWSLNHLLAYLASDIFEPEDDGFSLHLLKWKVLCLLMLATGRRIDEVAHLSQYVSWEDGGSIVKLHWLPNYKPKHYNKDFQPPMPAMECLAWNSPSEARLCPVKALQSFLAVVHPVEGSTRTHSLWSLDTVALSKIFVRAANKARRSAGDVSDLPVHPHQMRKFAASYSALMIRSSNLPEQKLLDRMGCKTMSVLNRTYINKVPRLTFKAVVPMGTFSPDVHNE